MRDKVEGVIQSLVRWKTLEVMNGKFGNGLKIEIFTLRTPHQIPQISYEEVSLERPLTIRA